MKVVFVLSFLLFSLAGVHCGGITLHMVGDTITIECKTPKTEGLRCSWTKQLLTSSPPTDLFPEDGSTTPNPRYELVNHPENGDCSLKIKEIILEDTAFYNCRIDPNVFEDTTQVIVVAVPGDPEMIVDGKHVGYGDKVNVDANTDVVHVDCQLEHALQSATAQMSWKVGHKEIHSFFDTEVQKIDAFRVRVISNLRLPVSILPKQAATTVTCTVRHMYYPAGTRDAHVILKT